MAAIAVDVGGTKMAVALVDADGAVTHEVRAPTDQGDPWTGLVRLVDRVREGAREDGVAVEGVGIGCGGPMRWPEGEVSPLNMAAWRGFPLRAALAGHCGVPARLHNDAVCLAVAEHWQGAGRGVDDVLGMVVSTGVGGGLLLAGRPVDGATGNAGHIGHVVVEPDGPRCRCGGRGCLEAVARGPAVVAWARARGSAAEDGVALAAAARAGESVAVAAFARTGRALGIGIAGAVALLDVRVVVVGGGLAQAGEPLWGPLQAELAERSRLDFLQGLRVEPTALAGHGGLLGAAALVLHGGRYWTGT